MAAQNNAKQVSSHGQVDQRHEYFLLPTSLRILFSQSCSLLFPKVVPRCPGKHRRYWLSFSHGVSRQSLYLFAKGLGLGAPLLINMGSLVLAQQYHIHFLGRELPHHVHLSNRKQKASALLHSFCYLLHIDSSSSTSGRDTSTTLPPLSSTYANAASYLVRIHSNKCSGHLYRGKYVLYCPNSHGHTGKRH